MEEGPDKDRLLSSATRGLPRHLRGSIWYYLSRAHSLSACFSDQVYCRLMQTSEEEVDSTILRDVYRTFPTVDMFKDPGGYGQRGLYNVLRAYSAYDPEIAYCQGMGFIVGLLLTELYTEEQAFWVFVQIMHSYHWRFLFQYPPPRTDTPKLIAMMEALSQQVARTLPRLYRHLEGEEVPLDVPFTPFVMTIFACGTPHELAVRVMDVFLVKGEEVLFTLLLRMLLLKEEEVLSLHSEVPATQSLYNYLKHSLVLDCCAQYPLTTLLTPL